ncbi:hypothetical protein KAT92_05705 [Candidatus Babeliales bacterium]|nr:hypothetical protein [Candidatus Babeliales bacterium]
MTKDRQDSILKGESPMEYAAFLEFVDERDLKKAYNGFMQNNPAALASFKNFVSWASQHLWQARVNDIDAENELVIVRETRRAGLDNNLTAEAVSKELFQTCVEEMQLRKADLTHKDIGKYLDIATKINDRWVDKSKDSPNVVVNVDQSNTTVDVPEELLRRLGKEMVEEDND